MALFIFDYSVAGIHNNSYPLSDRIFVRYPLSLSLLSFTLLHVQGRRCYKALFIHGRVDSYTLHFMFAVGSLFKKELRKSVKSYSSFTGAVDGTVPKWYDFLLATLRLEKLIP